MNCSPTEVAIDLTAPSLEEGSLIKKPFYQPNADFLLENPQEITNQIKFKNLTKLIFFSLGAIW